jgi:hypothetical protein
MVFNAGAFSLFSLSFVKAGPYKIIAEATNGDVDASNA